MRVSNLAAAATSAALLAAPPAWADVTPDQVWSDLQAYLAGFGYSVSAEESRAGDALTLTDMTVTMTFPEDDGEMRFQLEEMVLRDQGDGTVALDMPTTMPLTITVAPTEGEEAEAVIDYTLQDMEMVIAGDPGDMTYVYSAASMALVLSELVVDGEVIPRDKVAVQISAAPLDGETQVSLEDGMRRVRQSFTVGELSYDLTGSDDTGAGLLAGMLTGVSTDSTTVVPEAMDAADMSAMLRSGMTIDAEMRYTAGQSRFSVTEDDQTSSGETSSQGGSLTLAMSQDALTYDLRGLGMNVTLSSPEMPFPIAAEMDEMRLGLTMPVGASEEPVDAKAQLTMAGFTASDEVWSLFDPMGVLPRDPATVLLDLAAKVTPTVDLLDPAQIEALGGETPPGELNALTLNNLTIAAAGAQIVGDGDFTFDNDDLESFDGLPRPVGALNLQVSGANGLIDKLIQMGLVREQDAMGARMMMSMFAVPGSAPDTMSSTIEVNEQGQVFANGQRIK